MSIKENIFTDIYRSVRYLFHQLFIFKWFSILLPFLGCASQITLSVVIIYMPKLVLDAVESKVTTEQLLKKGSGTNLLKDISEEGTELSGGEEQRLLLARALYKDASVLILDELLEGQNKGKLLMLCMISIGIACILTICKAYLEAKLAVGFSHLFSGHEIHLTQKSYKLPYETLESADSKALRDKVSGNLNLSGGGMASLYWDMDCVFTNGCTIIIASVLLFDFFKNLAVHQTNAREAIKIILIIACLIVVCSVVSCKMTSKFFDVSFEIFQHGAKYNRYGEFYTMDYLMDEHAALDVRIFRQDKTIIEESQKKCYQHFARGNQKEMRALNKYDGTKLFCSCLCGTVLYFLIGQNAIRGMIGIGSVLMIYSAATMLIHALSDLAQVITDLRNNNEHLLLFFQYMDLPEDELEAENKSFDKVSTGKCGKRKHNTIYSEMMRRKRKFHFLRKIHMNFKKS